MNTVHPFVEICKERGLKKIELIAKVCTKKEHNITETSALKFVRDRVAEGHNAILGHEYEYFNVSNLLNAYKVDLLVFNPYIRISNRADYIAVSWRSLLDMMFYSKRNYTRSYLLQHEEPTYDIARALWVLSDEFRSIFNITVEELLDNMTNRRSIVEIEDLIQRVEPEEILNNAPEIYVATVKFVTDRGIGNEIVRHAEITPMQESTRWCDYKEGKTEGVNFVNPFEEPEVEIATQNVESLEDVEEAFFDAIADAETHYNVQRSLGVSPQLARNVLPLALKTEMFMTGTLDMWFGEEIEQKIGNLTVKEKKGFIPQRTAKQAHPQLRPLAERVKQLLTIEYPTYEQSKFY